MRGLLIAVVLMATSTDGLVRADYVDLGPAQNYNVFVFNNDTQYGTDAQGRVAVGGNAYFDQNGQGYTVASAKSTSTMNLVIGGNYTNRYQSINGDVFVGGAVSVIDPTIHGNLTANGNIALNPTGNQGGTIDKNVTSHGTITNQGVTIGGTKTQNAPTAASPIDFTAAEASLKGLSSDLGSQAQTAGAVVDFSFNNLKLTAPSGSYIVFHITNTQLATMNDFKLSADARATVVINVDDVGGNHADSFHNNGMSITGTDKQHVLFNFYQATSLTTNGIGVQGSVLAALADVNFNSGNIDGTMIAKSISGNGESHDFAFKGQLLTVRAVPEPGSIALLAMGGIGGLLMLRRKAKTASA